MAGILSVAVPIVQPVSTAGTVIAEAQAAAQSEPALVELGITFAGSGVLMGLGRASSAGVGPTGQYFAQNHDADDPARPGATRFYNAWQISPPGAPTQYLRRQFFVQAAGGGCIWTFPRGIIFNSNASLVLALIAATGGGVVGQTWWTINE
jgi:hypothetical protein